MKPIQGARVRKPAGGPELPREGTLLYVEDDAQNRLVAAQRLGKDYDLLMASTDEEACRLWRDNFRRIGCVLMDIQLQGSLLSGLDLTRLIRGLTIDQPVPPYAAELPVAQTPVVFLTAYGSTWSDDELVQTGANHLLAKPVNFVRLSLALTQIKMGTLTREFSRG